MTETHSPAGTFQRGVMDRFVSPYLALNAAATFAFLYIPIVVLLAFSFTASRRATVWSGFSFEPYQRLFGMRRAGPDDTTDIARDSGQQLMNSLKNSLVIALAVTVVSTALGTAAAFWLERYASPRRRALYDSLLTLPILIPDIVQGISLLLFFAILSQWMSRVLGGGPIFGRGTVIVAQSAFAISYVAVIVRARLAGLNKTLEEAAMDLGANEWRVFTRITLPLIWPGVLGGALLAFTLSLDEFVITFFTCGPESTTLPVRIWSMVKVGVTPEVNALSSILLVVSIGLVTLSVLLQRKK